MKTYRVRYEIDLDAESHEDAALRTLEILRDPTALRPTFDVIEWENSGPGPVAVEIDLDD